jgi:hypothetical protein
MKESRRPKQGLASALVFEEERRILQEDYDRWEKLVCRIFVTALLNHDRETILELANAASFLQGKISANPNPIDKTRYKILGLMTGSFFAPRPKTIEEIADHLDGKREHTPNRIRQLEAICKDLKYPLKRKKL